MRIVITRLLIGLAAGIAGCNSHTANEGHANDRPASSRVNPVVGDRAINQAAGQAINTIDRTAATADRVIDTATASADRTVHEVNRTALTVQSDAQRATSDAARLSNDATRAGSNLLNNAQRDVNKLNNLLR